MNATQMCITALRFFFVIPLLAQGIVLVMYPAQFVDPRYGGLVVLYLLPLVVWILFTMGKIPIKYLSAVWATYVCIAFVPMLGTILGTVIYAYDEQQVTNANSTRSEIRYLNKGELFGPNTFKMAVCGTPLLFILLLATTHLKGDRDAVINLNLVGALEFFDGIEMLEVYIGAERELAAPTSLKIVIAFFVCFSFFVSPLEFLENKIDDDGVLKKLKKRRRTFIAYALIQALLINGVYLVIRLCLWFIYHTEASIFIAKNAITIIILLVETRVKLASDSQLPIDPASDSPGF